MADLQAASDARTEDLRATKVALRKLVIRHWWQGINVGMTCDLCKADTYNGAPERHNHVDGHTCPAEMPADMREAGRL